MKIVSLSIYPIDVPLHGGQRRSAAIVRALGQNGAQVCHLSVEHPHGYPHEVTSTSHRRLRLPVAQIKRMARDSLRQDVHTYTCFDDDDGLFAEFCAALVSEKPDVLWFEQPWLWPVVHRAMETFPTLRRALVAYSSQNVEHVLLGSIVAAEDALPETMREGFVAEAYDIERSLAAAADVCLSATATDGDLLFEDSAAPRFVIGNGIDPPVPVTAEALPSSVDASRRNALFVGSYHLPNMTGFFSMLGCAMGYLAPDERILVAGGVSDLLKADRAFHLHGAVNRSRVTLLGTIDDAGLSAVLDAASVMLLPITEGGGSNLKTAEALLTGKPVVATPQAFVGYEDFNGLPGVTVTEDPEVFRAGMREGLHGDAGASLRTIEMQRHLRELLWERRTAAIRDVVATLERLLAKRTSANAKNRSSGIGPTPSERVRPDDTVRRDAADLV